MRAARATTTTAKRKPAPRASAPPPPSHNGASMDAPPPSPANRPGATASRPPSNKPTSSAAAPQFGYLILTGFECVGITYISMDRLRKAKKSLHTEREYLELWKLLHDLVLVVLADFDVDVDEMRRANTGDALEAALMDSASQRHEIVATATVEFCHSSQETTAVVDMSPLAFESQIHQLHAAYGRLASHVNELKSYMRYHQRLLLRLEQMQQESKSEQKGSDDEVIPAVKMVEDEQLFYKWINSLLATYPFQGNISKANDASLGESFPALVQEIQATQALFQTNFAAYQELSKRFELEWKKWRQEKQKSRSQLQQMEMKMERISHDVASRELFDPQKMFLQSAQSWETQRRKISGVRESTRQQQVAFPCEQDLESLKSQLDRVLKEISTEYCHAQFR
ncbi:hypothetical protein FI667_g14389, partial [Globisporangium splendens]